MEDTAEHILMRGTAPFQSQKLVVLIHRRGRNRIFYKRSNGPQPARRIQAGQCHEWLSPTRHATGARLVVRSDLRPGGPLSGAAVIGRLERFARARPLARQCLAVWKSSFAQVGFSTARGRINQCFRPSTTGQNRGPISGFRSKTFDSVCRLKNMG